MAKEKTVVLIYFMIREVPGYLSVIHNKKLIIIIILQAALVLAFSGYSAWKRSSIECVRCHSDRKKMKELKHPEFFVTKELVEKQSNHPFVECRECHLGNGRAKDKDKAHEGMLKMLIVGDDGTLKDREDHYPYALGPTGSERIWELLPKIEIDGELWHIPGVRNILWHDRDPETFNFDPGIAKKTCAKPKCHPDQLDQFSASIMGRNFRQRTMRTWMNPYGPQNCGPSFADPPPPNVLQRSDFDYENTQAILDNLNVPFTKQHAEDKQKFCNVCHAGCLDCHFTPAKGKPHTFTRVPKSESCAGFGRGTSICHPGAMQSRRGETYIGGDYSVPPGMKPDVHYKKNIHCVDCHPTGEKGMGDMERKASCRDCHLSIEKAHAKSIHKDMDCSTCHINKLGGYQITVWGPGLVADKPNPFKKYSYYYGFQSPPILLKDQKGKWMPVKIWPHSVGNIKNDIPRSPSIQFRWPDGETKDAYFIIGTVDGLPENNKHLLWLEIEQVAHPFGKSRSCKSCHEEEQKSVSTWEFYDYQGAGPFEGTYTIIADKNGLFIKDLQNTTPIMVMEGYSKSDFASWLYLKDRWSIPGNFGIKTDSQKYSNYLAIDKKLSSLINKLDGISKGFDKKTLRLYRDMKGASLHNADTAIETINQFRVQKGL